MQFNVKPFIDKVSGSQERKQVKHLMQKITIQQENDKHPTREKEKITLCSFYFTFNPYLGFFLFLFADWKEGKCNYWKAFPYSL